MGLGIAWRATTAAPVGTSTTTLRRPGDDPRLRAFNASSFGSPKPPESASGEGAHSRYCGASRLPMPSARVTLSCWHESRASMNPATATRGKGDSPSARACSLPASTGSRAAARGGLGWLPHSRSTGREIGRRRPGPRCCSRSVAARSGSQRVVTPGGDDAEARIGRCRSTWRVLSTR